MFPFGLFTELSGAYQFENMFTILKALATLTRLNYNIRSQDYRAGLAKMCIRDSFNIDKESTPDKLIFNRTVGLKDTWGKINK